MLSALKQIRREYPDAETLVLSPGQFAIIQGEVLTKKGKCTRHEIREMVPFPFIIEHKITLHDRVVLKTKGKPNDIVMLPEFR